MQVSRLSAALAVTVSVLLSCAVVQATNYTDVDILNFALNLECLEAEYYSWAAYGEGLASVDSAATGSDSALTTTSSGATAGAFDSTPAGSAVQAIAIEIAENEIAHVKYLRAALGDSAVACPSLALSSTTFTDAASAALTNYVSDATLGGTFNPYGTYMDFLLGAFIFEDVGVTAYKGAVANLESGTYAAVAAGIMAIEAGHAAIIRDQLIAIASTATTDLTYTTTSSSTAVPIDYGTAAAAISNLRNVLGNTTGTASVDLPLTRNIIVEGNQATATAGAPDLFPSDGNAVAFTRTPTQVLDIVYFSNTTTPGGFLPKGISGNSDVLQITATSVRTCSSGAVSMASLSVVSVAVLVGAFAFGL